MEQSAAAAARLGPTGHMLGRHVVTRDPAFENPVTTATSSSHSPLYADFKQWVSDRSRINTTPKFRGSAHTLMLPRIPSQFVEWEGISTMYQNSSTLDGHGAILAEGERG